LPNDIGKITNWFSSLANEAWARLKVAKDAPFKNMILCPGVLGGKRASCTCFPHFWSDGSYSSTRGHGNVSVFSVKRLGIKASVGADEFDAGLTDKPI
jgi:hypothetical protein